MAEETLLERVSLLGDRQEVGPKGCYERLPADLQEEILWKRTFSCYFKLVLIISWANLPGHSLPFSEMANPGRSPTFCFQRAQ